MTESEIFHRNLVFDKEKNAKVNDHLHKDFYVKASYHFIVIEQIKEGLFLEYKNDISC